MTIKEKLTLIQEMEIRNTARIEDDTSASAYILNDDVTADFTVTTGDKLCSIAGAKPASGLTNNLTRRNCGKLAENRGAGWYQSYGQLIAATQLLMVVEYATFNMQSAIGNGNVSETDDGATSMNELTGATTNLGNASGAVRNINNIQLVTYRGEENLWGNIWKFVDGLNIYPYGLNELYVSDHAFTESTKEAPYENAGITLCKTNGYVSAMAYNEKYDWLFFPSECNGNSSLPVSDYFYQNNTYANGFFIARLGGRWDYGGSAGAFSWGVGNSVGSRYRYVGGRLAYVPGVSAA